MIKEFIFLFVCFISIFIYLLCSDKLCSARIMQFQQFDDISLKNFVYLWKEFQTPSGLKALKNTLGEQHNVETNCLKVLEELTELDFFPREEFTVDNENFMLKLCEEFKTTATEKGSDLVQLFMEEVNKFDENVLG